MRDLKYIILKAIVSEKPDDLKKIVEENKDKFDTEFKKEFEDAVIPYLDSLQDTHKYTDVPKRIFDILIDSNLIGQDVINKRLFYALRKKDDGAVIHFLRMGADPNYIENGQTPLTYVIDNAETNYKRNYDRDVVEMLCDYGADPNLQSPIKLAITKGRTDIVERLIQKGATHPKELEEILKSLPDSIYWKSKKLPKEYRKAFKMGRENYGYRSIIGKIKDKISSIEPPDIAMVFASTVVGACAIAMLGITAHGANSLIVEGNLNRATEELNNNRIELGQTIANKAGLSNFDIASVELAQGGNDYILKAFGSTSAEQIAGLKKNDYLNIFFNISESQARGILDAVNKADQAERIESYNTPEHIIGFGETKSWSFHENGKVNSTKEVLTEVYKQLNNAVNNAYSCEIETVSEASAMNNSISREYRYTRPEVIEDTNGNGLFTHGNTTFVNSGVVTTGISQVVKDETRGVSYFFIDTLQGRTVDDDVAIESCRAMVIVDGTDLTQEEVYAKFIRGEYLSFTEILREKVGSKTGIVGNQLHDNVDEIELL